MKNLTEKKIGNNMYYTKQEISAILGITPYEDDVFFSLEEMNLTDIKNIDKLTEHVENIGKTECVQDMLNRLRLGGGLPAPFIDKNDYLTDGVHRICAHIMYGSKKIWVLKKKYIQINYKSHAAIKMPLST